MNNARNIFGGDGIIRCKDTLSGSDGLPLLTQRPPFRCPDFEGARSLMKTRIIFEGGKRHAPGGRNIPGSVYFGIGRNQK